MILKGYLLGICYALVCLVLSLVLYKIGLPKKYTRKLVHILVGFEWVILRYYHGPGIHFLFVCLFFLLLLSLAYKLNFMPMISSEGDNSPGTVYYAVAMTGVAIVMCFVPNLMVPFGMGIFCTSVGDGLAAVVGQLIKRANPKIYNDKSLFGTITCFVVSFACVYALDLIFNIRLGILPCLALALLSCELEIICGHGLDNIGITWGVTAFAYMLMYTDFAYDYVCPILLTPLIIIFAVKKNALNKLGIALALVLDVIVSFAFKNFGFIMLSAFLVLSIFVDKIKRRAKGTDGIEAKGDLRDEMQVIANGFAAAVCCMLYAITRNFIFAVGYVAAIAEAFADTVASGLGVFSKKTVDLFRFRTIEKGLSGGMSLIGTLSSLIAAFAISLLALPFNVLSIYSVIVAAAAGFLGNIFDSLLGSLLQVKYRCNVCDMLTEKQEHCGKPTVYYSGIKFLDNDMVNLLSGVFAAILAVTISYVLL